MPMDLLVSRDQSDWLELVDLAVANDISFDACASKTSAATSHTSEKTNELSKEVRRQLGMKSS